MKRETLVKIYEIHEDYIFICKFYSFYKEIRNSILYFGDKSGK